MLNGACVKGSNLADVRTVGGRLADRRIALPGSPSPQIKAAERLGGCEEPGTPLFCVRPCRPQMQEAAIQKTKHK